MHLDAPSAEGDEMFLSEKRKRSTDALTPRRDLRCDLSVGYHNFAPALRKSLNARPNARFEVAGMKALDFIRECGDKVAELSDRSKRKLRMPRNHRPQGRTGQQQDTRAFMRLNVDRAGDKADSVGKADGLVDGNDAIPNVFILSPCRALPDHRERALPNICELVRLGAALPKDFTLPERTKEASGRDRPARTQVEL
jgi:hypothetical protein